MRTDVVALFARDPEPPMDEAALSIAADLHPYLDADATRAELDDLAAPLRSRAASLRTPADHAALLGTYVYDELGFAGDEETYDDPRNNDLVSVLARRRGVPISLAVVLAALGRRAGIAVDGIGFPGHFLARVGGVGGAVVDPFFHARVLDDAGVASLLRKVLGDDAVAVPELLAPCGARAVAVRMLANLKNSFERRGDHARALVACDRLVDLTGAAEPRRDRGMHALALGSPLAAAEDLRAYLAARPSARDAVRVREALDTLAAGVRKFQ